MTVRDRVGEFCATYGLSVPILQAPMAGSSPPALARAAASAGAMGGRGVLRDPPERIAQWMTEFGSAGPVQLNIWVPEEPGSPDDERRALAEAFLARFGVPGTPPDRPRPDYRAQLEAMLAARPTVVSSIMGIFDAGYVRRLHDAGIAWFACATTLPEALAAQEAGADAVVAQGTEAGGHRGCFDQDVTAGLDSTLFALVPHIADHLRVPVVAAGGIGDGRGVAAALALGASAVQVGTALLRTPEAGISANWSAALAGAGPEAVTVTRAYTGRTARAVSTAFLREWQRPEAPRPARFPDQLGLVGRWRAGNAPGIEAENYFAGQSAALATTDPAAEVITRMWREASMILA
ncbi:nitronate monooxygenase [Actinoplanes sp. TBRC 11911]|uniref:NAD(P)H-dependent flavin oxidoreductase n=1 Tax=Actinoplanes sp. TBRC 11911 TaxID=2729386 RepID=UPI00145C41EB|nr:nitronate monooxygenase [Actinoplanes sp. TBRC 11911]NMO49707.1 nitronate monooxygenase [Actinoplanes sp. TBRC 11911]